MNFYNSFCNVLIKIYSCPPEPKNYIDIVLPKGYNILIIKGMKVKQ